MSDTFTIWQIVVWLWVEGTDDHSEYGNEWDPLSHGYFDQAEIEARRPVVDEIRLQLEPLFNHLVSIGSIRADKVADDETPTFYLVVAGACQAPEYYDPQSKEHQINFGQLEQRLSSISGATLKARAVAQPVSHDAILSTLHTIDPGKAIGCWGGNDTTERLRNTAESDSEWFTRVAVQPDPVGAVFNRLARVGYDLNLYSLFFDPEKVADTEWLVDGVIGFGALTLLVGCGASGKSSALHELLSVTNALDGPKTFFGRKVNDRHPGVLLSGEETEGALKHRQDRHSEAWSRAEPMIFKGAGPHDLETVLNQLESVPGKGLLVVDPATTFLDGDETKTHVVSNFYNPLVAFARRKEWAVVVAHHLVKDPPKSLSRILSSVKGSTVHTDRARMVIAMIDRRNGTVEVGPIKHNYPEGAWIQIDQGQFFRRDPETFRLLPVDAELPKAPRPENDLLQLIRNVIAKLNAEDLTVNRTGASGLYKLKLAELHGIPRNILENGILTLLEAGALINSDKGLVAAQTQQSFQLALEGACP